MAESLQQQLDTGRTGNAFGRERVPVNQIPSEYKRMYDKIEEMFDDAQSRHEEQYLQEWINRLSRDG